MDTAKMNGQAERLLSAMDVDAVAFGELIDSETGKRVAGIFLVHPEDLNRKASEDAPLRTRLIGFLRDPDENMRDRFTQAPGAVLQRFKSTDPLKALLRGIVDARDPAQQDEDLSGHENVVALRH